MLPFDNKPWAKPVAVTVIVFTLIAAVVAPVVLRLRHSLDTGAIVAIFLLLLAIIPPNIAVLLHRRRISEDQQGTAAHNQHAYAAHRADR